jgi:hypothetical protein
MKLAAESHVDHHLNDQHIAWLLERFGDRTRFFAETVAIPPELPALPCALHGPAMGDEPVPDAECRQVVRNGREGPSRVCSRSSRDVRIITVIAGPFGDEPCVLYTAYGGPLAPREPWDLALVALVGREMAESVAFWAQHALSEAS